MAETLDHFPETRRIKSGIADEVGFDLPEEIEKKRLLDQAAAEHGVHIRKVAGMGAL